MANKPNNPSLWSKAKSLAKQKFDVYPSAYANGWAAKWYKSKGGTWSKAAEYGMEVMEDGGIPDNEGFRALPPEVQQKIMSNMEYGGYMPEMPGGGIYYGTYAPPVFAAGGMPCYECGGMYEDGGGIPERYKNMGFDRVGQKKDSTSEGKKWMVLAKKGDDYKVVHGGYDGMKDFTQHGSEERRDRFWDRMGGKDSAKAKDPFSPLYWHKRFGTWAEGGELDMYDDGGYLYSGPYSNMYQEGDYQVDRTTRHKLENLENTRFNRALVGATSLTGPQSAATYLPKGSFLKGMMGLASGLSGATLGYKKMLADDKRDSKLMNTETGEYGNTQEILKARSDKAGPKVEPVRFDYGKPNVVAPYGITPQFIEQLKNQPIDPKVTPAGDLRQMGATLEGKNMYDDFSGASIDNIGNMESMDANQTVQPNVTNPVANPVTNPSATQSAAPDTTPGATPQAETSNQVINRGAGTAKRDAEGNYIYGSDATGWSKSKSREAAESKWRSGSYNYTPTSAPVEPVAIPDNLQNLMQGVQIKRDGGLAKFWPGGPFNTANGTNPIEQMLRQQSGQTGLGVQDDAQLGSYAAFNMQGTGANTPEVKMQKTWETESRGDDAGFVVGNNAIVGLGYFADWAERRDQRKNLNYDQQVRMMGNTDSMYNAYNPKNPFGNERTNMAVGPNSQLVMGTPLQDFSQVGAKWGGMKKYRQGGTYEVTPEEIMAILAAGGEIEYL